MESSARPNWIVLKFGGTSVSTADCWETIARVIDQRVGQGWRVMVVCSALSGVSNQLEQLADKAPAGDWEELVGQVAARHRRLGRELGVDVDAALGAYIDELGRLARGAWLTREVTPSLRARLLALGELMSTALGSAYLGRAGRPVDWRDARQMLQAEPAPELTRKRRYLSATCDCQLDDALRQTLADGADVVITQGFIARDGRGRTVLLGRGGSDTSAAYLGAKLGADRLEIWTDVPGMFTADPRVIPSARLLRQLGYHEAQELATMGASVLHPRCIDPLRRHHIPLHIRCTARPDVDGTVISGETPEFGAQVKAISAKTDLTLISMDTVGMWQEVGFLADIFEVFRQRGLSVDLVATSEANVTVSLDPMANTLDDAAINGLVGALNEVCDARALGPCAAVSLVGRNIRSILDELGPAFEVLDEQQIYLMSQAASDLNLTFVVDEEQAGRLVRKLHSQLFRARLSDRLFGSTWRELFGDSVNTPAGRAKPWWEGRRAQVLDIAAAGPAYVYSAARLDESVTAVDQLGAVDRVFYAMKANPNAQILARFEAAGLGFECVSPGEVKRVFELFGDIDPGRVLFTPNFGPREEYEFAFDRGIHVTLDNLEPLELWQDVFGGQDVIIRVDPGRGRGHHKYVRTAGSQSKFGVAPAEIDRLVDLADDAGARVVGLHAHVGSGITEADTWSQTAVFLASLRGRFPDLRFLNLGGGLAVPDRPGAAGLDVDAVADHLGQFAQAHPDLDLWVEPGRFMVADAGVLVARVTQTKTKADIRYIGVDTGMNSLIRPALYGAYHPIVNLSRLDQPLETTAEVVGPICESGDVLGHGRRLPKTEVGDILLVATCGAYGRAMSSRYNLREPADEYFLA